MINSLQLSKVIFLLLVILTLFNPSSSMAAEDIWKKKEEKKEENKKTENDLEEEINIESSVFSDEINKVTIKIDENGLKDSEQSVIGLFDPEKNNFNLNMWSNTDGTDIKKTLKRIGKLKLSELSENLLFEVLFTNAYPPKSNLSSEEFLKIKIDWLIKNKRIQDLEIFLKNNPEVGKSSKAIKFLINEYISSANIKSACEKIKFIDKNIQNKYLDKFTVYCLINEDRKEEAQLVFDLLKERGLKDNFFEDKINFLLGINENTSENILDNNLLNFYLSHITSNNFNYEPTEKTNKYIWKYLSSANLIKINDVEDKNKILTYEKAASDNSFDADEIFKIYLKMHFSFNQLANAEEIYKNLQNYEARSLIYQSILLSDNTERKLRLAFLLKELFEKDKLRNVYKNELVNILESLDPETIPANYVELIEENLEKNTNTKIKFDNDVLHKSKVIRHFIDDNPKISRTEKDFKAVYKKIKRNKKYFISIKDIIVFDALASDGFSLPEDLDYSSLSLQLNVPQNLQDLANENQIGLVMLKIVEIIGEDKIGDLDPETVYFLNSILNDLNLKKIRNDILSLALPVRA